ncbi:MAG: arginine:ornithine antiporter, partial [Proteiniphilum sp.]|nr:arginine:ornithine antiporter [Proteiniphilum sp.]
LYSVYVIYAVGIRYLILSVLFYGVGSLLYLKAKREQQKQPKRWEWAAIIILLSASAVIITLMLTGRIIP